LLFAIAIFASIGGLRAVFAAFAATLAAAPIGVSPIDTAAAAIGLARLVASALALSLSIAAPAGLAVVLAEIALGLVGRVAPGVPVFFVGMPLRASVGLAMTLVALAFVAEGLPATMLRAIDDAVALLRAAH
jgi:flagellar biosynthesis protein FliR